MKKIFTVLVSCVLLGSCLSNKNYPKAENALDAGREFIDGCLKGDFDKAEFYMLKDETNNQQLEKLQKDYNQKSKEDKQQYKEASINILNEETLSDSIHIIYYKNSFDKVARKVKVVEINGNWMVDFKYTFNGNL